MTSDDERHVSLVAALTPAERAEVVDVERAAARTDGVAALDEQVRLDLQYADQAVRHLLLRGPVGSLVGYAHLRSASADATPPGVGAAVGHLVVAPQFRRRGHGSTLLARMRSTAPPGLLVWAHGDLDAAGRLAQTAGLHRVRELWQLRRPLDASLDEPRYPAGVTVRTFMPGQDEARWLALNALAFADHPEQGGVSATGLAQRMAQPDFDATGFFLVERDKDLLGFHWTKVHPADGPGGKPEGEVYVLGVHPAAQGLGLGKALTLTGLQHLRSRNLTSVTLYVEADNSPAVAMYSRLGFTRSAVDAAYLTDDH